MLIGLKKTLKNVLSVKMLLKNQSVVPILSVCVERSFATSAINYGINFIRIRRVSA